MAKVPFLVRLAAVLWINKNWGKQENNKVSFAGSYLDRQRPGNSETTSTVSTQE